MSDIPEIPRGAPRHWLEYVSTFVAVIISVVSLWVAIGSEDANRKMVAASSWPFLQVTSGNSDGQDHPNLNFHVTNAGVGPAKVKSFEVFWKHKPYRTSFELMHDCCGYEIPTGAPQTATGTLLPGQVSSSRVARDVIRSGEDISFLSYPLVPENVVTWKKFDNARQLQMSYRICYCSVFDECWTDTFDFGGDAGPQRVGVCPVPKVPYIE
jgi:hypothetical protein